MNQLISNSNEFNFTDQQISCMEELKKLIEASEKLQIGTENKFLSKFLNYTSWNVNKAFEIINGYYEFKFNHDEVWITNKSPEDFQDLILNGNARYLLPKCDKNGRYVVIYRLPNIFDRYPDIIDILTRLDDLILETLLSTRRGQENGLSVIFDIGNFSKKYLKFLSPKHLMTVKRKKAIFPLKNPLVHIIQTGLMLNIALGLIMPLIGALFENDTVFHKERKSDKLKEMIGYDALPHEYGGPEENILDGNILYNFLLENKDFVKKVQGYNKIE